MITMDKKINWKNVTITMLTNVNLLLINEVRTIEQDTINAIYMDQVETGFYNESSTDVTRNPMSGKIESMLLNNHEQGNY